ncbi:hypothetical protein PV08_10328 [Exophiala spinifera]|uniref:Uncharacterized protein n=1 Tax=Exophiala spinifera TaxID=91928 RepID=A0A0D2BI68_9EURO|nr:uncharacterized protein PV08_10328 [Exophiala spinifera]KIW11029.1 hypothetical protein PV08_10328 [Exophiala spinifera]
MTGRLRVTRVNIDRVFTQDKVERSESAPVSMVETVHFGAELHLRGFLGRLSLNTKATDKVQHGTQFFNIQPDLQANLNPPIQGAVELDIPSEGFPRTMLFFCLVKIRYPEKRGYIGLAVTPISTRWNTLARRPLSNSHYRRVGLVYVDNIPQDLELDGFLGRATICLT